MKKSAFLAAVLVVLCCSNSYAFESQMMPVSLSDSWMYYECLRLGLDVFCYTDKARPFPMNYSLISSRYVILGDYLTVPEDMKLVSSDGSVVDDEICAGEKVRAVKGVDKGEYWDYGGFLDSPPVYWVDDVEKSFEDIVGYGIRTGFTEECSVDKDAGVPDGSIDPVTGVPIYTTFGYPTLKGATICSLKDKGVSSEGFDKIGDWYAAKGKGMARFTANYSVECVYYVYALGYTDPYTFGNYNLSDYPGGIDELIKEIYSCPYKPLFSIIREPTINLMGGVIRNDSNDYKGTGVLSEPKSLEDLFRTGNIGIDKEIKVVSTANPKVDVSVVGADNVSFGSPNTFRALVKNTGDVNVSIKSIYSKPEGKLISCDAESLAPGQQAECLLLVTPVQGQGLSVEVSYDYKSCGRSQVGLVTKTLIDSKTVRPVLKEQSYLMGVHGACDNGYYSCYSASEGSLFAGYKCFKTSNGFYAPASERINMRFDISEVPKNAEILGAKLYLKASEVGEKQTINVYSVDRIPEVVKCLPGGDICTKPYCGECKPLYDLDGTVASSAEISSARQYSFDVTNSVKDKLQGDGIVSLQIRGAEGLWESQGQSSCTIENDWDKRDISIDAGGRDGPYLEVVYR